MSQYWEDKFSAWAKPPGEAEEARCANAESMVRKAIAASTKLQSHSVRVFVQGSYRNNTNIPRESDVDIGALCEDVIFPEYPPGVTNQSVGLSDTSYTYAQFKNEVGEALTNYFGAAAVKRGNKAFDIKATSHHVEADVAPFFMHRRYRLDRTYVTGVELRPDNNPTNRIQNWPEQHYNNGVAKNEETNRRFKATVRVLKNLCGEMSDKSIPETTPIIGFLIECLVWNVSNGLLADPSYYERLKSVIAFLWERTSTQAGCNDWGEVNELKYLFRDGQKWTREQANAFLLAAWSYVGFK
jgi:hypothetical protein